MSALINWIPYKLSYQENDWQLLWLDLQDKHIEEPFFDETIQHCHIKMRERSRYSPASNLDFLVEAANGIDFIPPAAFIFHVSRCGSTLLSQALATAETNIVFAEAPLIDELLRMKEQDPSITEEQQELWFKSALALMGQKRKREYKQLHVKLDSWHIHFYPLLRKWFPDTPFFFLSREPKAIIASHQQRRGIHSVPGMVNPSILKVDIAEKHYEDFNLFTAEVLAKYYDALKDIVLLNHPKDSFYDYSWGTNLLLSQFLKVVDLSDSADERMFNRLNFYSKSPGEKFKGDNKLTLASYPVANMAYEDFLKQLTKP
ncbi:hypothetical protein [Pedobacter rhizosphaerae]|uniref:Sulfotransferase family protein n=1 Tax=Pedobacter rhizosphaerae TaxID=390241 RepID=A0A1H9TX21_9SPHI|nr:hypothetical protein [Pedobacter rhizosphaerae]SES01313.1 hypothetical protein SAMN04488023_12512 [Pedobacter rhizosphaerae]